MVIQIDDLPYLEVFSPEYARAPHDVIRPVRDQAPLARSKRGVEVLAFAQCEQLLRDETLACGFPEMFELSGVTSGRTLEAFTNGIVETEGDRHRQLRQAVSPYFTKTRIEALREFTYTEVSGWLAEVADAGECDFELTVGRRLPAALFCKIIGAPVTDADQMAVFSDAVTRIFQNNPDHADFIVTNCAGLEQYIYDLMEHYRHTAGDGLISIMLEAVAAGVLSEREVVDMCFILLGGSVDTTNAQLCLNAATLAREQATWRSLRADPSNIGKAVQEVVRYAPAMWNDVRIPREGTVFNDLQVPPGTHMFANIVAANWDPDRYDHPERFDMLRGGVTGGALNFGRGRHFCLGRMLATMEMEETLRATLDNWSEVELESEPEMWGAPFPLRAGRVPLTFTVAPPI